MEDPAKPKVMSDARIEWESRKLGAMVGFCSIFVASVIGGKALGLGARANAASSIATGIVTGYMWGGFTRQAYQKKRHGLLEECSAKGIVPEFE
ncbi:hypothetical protein H4R18_004763 [Coemansia javaensis]|uniref:Uncharacterized protein n=1 Tax=Coemansia javaensis TaxID=2761396 RepID=A0A9W8LFU1_9FUNG|nr:hypothetical protein H4R18_004763 [Coemansia javaensis]